MFSGLLRFLLSLVILAVILLITFIVLDYTASAQGDRHGAARAILDSARYAIPQSVLDYYAALKIQFLNSWIDAIKDFFVTVFG
ncbi:MAG TPA: hypothetical protein VN538_03005 [Clostridia bacterium]|nr:hypothetical protein [Clostridia bacterium]